MTKLNPFSPVTTAAMFGAIGLAFAASYVAHVALVRTYRPTLEELRRVEQISGTYVTRIGRSNYSEVSGTGVACGASFIGGTSCAEVLSVKSGARVDVRVTRVRSLTGSVPVIAHAESGGRTVWSSSPESILSVWDDASSFSRQWLTYLNLSIALGGGIFLVLFVDWS